MKKKWALISVLCLLFSISVNAADHNELEDANSEITEQFSSPYDGFSSAVPKTELNTESEQFEQIEFNVQETPEAKTPKIAVRSSDGTWIQDKGRWWYRHTDGSYTKINWEKIHNTWFYFVADGWMVTGWLQLKGVWYYLWDNGSMATTWAKINDIWYYFDPNSGAMKTGWLQLGNTWYYLWDNGAMATGGQSIGSKVYYFDPNSGAMHTGWLQSNQEWFYYDSTGARQNPQKKIKKVEDTFRFWVAEGGWSVATAQIDYEEEYIKLGQQSFYVIHRNLILFHSSGATVTPAFDMFPVKYSDGTLAIPMQKYDVLVGADWDPYPYVNYNKLQYPNNTSVYGQASLTVYCPGAFIPTRALSAKINLKN